MVEYKSLLISLIILILSKSSNLILSTYNVTNNVELKFQLNFFFPLQNRKETCRPGKFQCLVYEAELKKAVLHS